MLVWFYSEAKVNKFLKSDCFNGFIK
ncbi:hypothetical protein EMIT0P294_50062 [Pseudomonas sp. IT-P294]